VVSIEGSTLGQERNPATLYDPKIVQMPLDSLYQRFAHIPLSCYYPLIHSTSKIIERVMPPPYDATGLPLVIREKDPEYQFHRVILFRRLLHVLKFKTDNVF
jgi:TBC domain-containing protein kinase-like protein